MELEEKAQKTIKMLTVLMRNRIDEKWRFPLNRYSEILVREGLEKLEQLFGKGFSNDRIVDYIVYQIYRYRDLINNSSWQISWCFSQNAVNKYKGQFIDAGGKSGMNYYIDLWLNEGGISRESLSAILKDRSKNPLKKFIYIESENDVKLRWHNTQAGFFLCQQATTGWSPKAPPCQTCNYKEDCMESTALKYPEIMRLRLESDGK